MARPALKSLPLSLIFLLSACSVTSPYTEDEEASVDDRDAPVANKACEDMPPNSDHSCKQQAEWGKCDRSWMKNFCHLSCGRCEPNNGEQANGGSEEGEVATGDYCQECNSPKTKGTAPSAIDEASGLAASRRHPGRYYVHNDSGDSARLFAIDEKGDNYGSYAVAGAQAVDWEDVAVGPCGAGSCVYIGDVGDNAKKRSQYQVYRVAEPDTLKGGEHTVKADVLPFTYPDGSHNCETLMVHPSSGDIFVVTKTSSGSSGLYRFPSITPNVPVVLQKLGKLAPPSGDKRFTAGDIHPKGSGILLRTYTKLFYYPLTPQLSSAKAVEKALTGSGCSVPVASEGQGETVAWSLEGSGWLTLSEGWAQSIRRVSCN